MDDLLSSSLTFTYFFQVLDVDLYLKNIIKEDDMMLLEGNSINDFLEDKLIVSLILEYLDNTTLKMLIKINSAEHSGAYFIVEKNLFVNDGYVVYKVFIEDISVFERYVKQLNYLEIESKFSAENKTKLTKNSTSVNVLKLLDKICKNDKEPMINFSTDNIDENSFSKLGFYRTVPKKRNANQSPENGESKKNKVVDPKSFFLTKYYNLLYGISFPSRSANKEKFYNYIKNSVKNSLLKHCDYVVKQTSAETTNKKGTTNIILYKNVIENSSMSLDDLEMKYSSFEMKVKTAENKILSQYEYEFDVSYHRNQYIFKNWNIIIPSKSNSDGTYDSDLLDLLARIFKIRELKLQIITHLELLTFTSLDSNFSNFFEVYKEENRQPKSFASFKNKHKKIAPKPEPLDICQVLNVLVNKLCIAEALIEQSIDLSSEELELAEKLNSDAKMETSTKKQLKDMPPKVIINWYLKNCLFNDASDESLAGFYNKCLVPVYKKRLPKCLKFFRHKFEGTTFEQTVNNDPVDSLPNNRVSSLRKAPTKNLQQLLNSDVSLLERQDSEFSSTQERLKLLEKRITSMDNKHYKLNRSSDSKNTKLDQKLLRRSRSHLRDDKEIASISSDDSPGKLGNPVIEIDGRKFKRAKLETNRTSFQRTGSFKSFSLLEKLSQTFQEPQMLSETAEVAGDLRESNENRINENEDDIFFKFSQRMNAGSQRFNYGSSDSEVIIKATPRKKSTFVHSPYKASLLSSAIKATPQSSNSKQSPLKNMVLSSEALKAENIVSPDQNGNSFAMNSSPFKTPHSAIIEEESTEDTNGETHAFRNMKMARRKLFPE